MSRKKERQRKIQALMIEMHTLNIEYCRKHKREALNAYTAAIIQPGQESNARSLWNYFEHFSNEETFHVQKLREAEKNYMRAGLFPGAVVDRARRMRSKWRKVWRKLWQ